MTYYFDTSALVKYFRVEPGSETVQSLIEPSGASVWFLSLALLEMRSALNRLVRTGEMTRAEAEEVVESIKEKCDEFNILPMSNSLVEQAGAIMTRFGVAPGIRTLDALHLAGLHLFGEVHWTFVAADVVLCRTAEALGYTVINPLQD